MKRKLKNAGVWLVDKGILFAALIFAFIITCAIPIMVLTFIHAFGTLWIQFNNDVKAEVDLFVLSLCWGISLLIALICGALFRHYTMYHNPFVAIAQIDDKDILEAVHKKIIRILQKWK